MGLMVRWRQAWYLVNDITKERGEGRGEGRGERRGAGARRDLPRTLITYVHTQLCHDYIME